MEEMIVKSGAAKLAVNREGAGQSLVFLHAGVADRRSWKPLMNTLSGTMRRFQRVSYDRRGFGDSTFVEERHSRVGDCIAVLDACGLGSAVLIGNSQGGRIAIDTALLHTARVQALVLIGTAVSGAPDIVSYPPEVAELIHKIETAEVMGDLDEINRLEAHLWLDGPSSMEGRVGGAARELFLDMNIRALRAQSVGEVTDNVDAWNNLSRLKVPVLVIAGQLDLPHLLERSNHIACVVPDAKLVTIKDTAHLPALEEPQLCAEIIEKFLARHNLV